MRRREANSSTLSFIDSISCGFGAVLLLFILTAKQQILETDQQAQQAVEAARTLQVAIEEAEAEQKSLEKEIAALDPKPDSDTTSLAELAARRERLAKAIQEQSEALRALESEEKDPEATAALDRPSADRSYLSGLRLRGPRVVIVLESSGSMLGETASGALQRIQAGTGANAPKWRRAKAAVRTVLAAIPKGTLVAVFQSNERTTPLTGSPANPFIDPYQNAALLSFLDRLDQLEASGGVDLGRALRTVEGLPDRPSSLLYIGDGLPTAPARGGSLSEADRVGLFRAATSRPFSYPVNTLLLPFEGDPAAAGLFWELSGRTGGVTLVPDESWPPQ